MMNIDQCIKKIDRYLKKTNVQPFIVDVPSKEILHRLVTNYNVGDNIFRDASFYCKADEYPKIDTLLNDVAKERRCIFITGLSSFLKLHGEEYVKESLQNILNMTIVGRVIFITYQCKPFLLINDPRIQPRVCIVDGLSDNIPKIIFLKDGSLLSKKDVLIDGIQNISFIVEESNYDLVCMKTNKTNLTYPKSLLFIVTINNAYEVLLQYDLTTAQLKETLGNDEQWKYALSLFRSKSRWEDVIDSEFGNHKNLELVMPSFSDFSNEKKWLFFIALHLFGAKNNWCLDFASSKAKSQEDLIRQIYRGLLDISYKNSNFEDYYMSRKQIVSYLKNTNDEIADYCQLLLSRGKEAIYYLTDNSDREKEYIFFLLDKYAFEYTKEYIMSALKIVYPDLYDYLQPFNFNNDFLNTYFQSYKYQKICNKVFSEFEKMVIEQSEKRDYNRLLPKRSLKIETIRKDKSMLYFVDAMGVEYLSFILSVCKTLKLMAKVTVCSCELPSITSMNKEFLNLFDEENIVNIKEIDDIKHHGKHNCNYQQTKLPIHLSEELAILRRVLLRIKENLLDGKVQKAILVSDHGASRLAVIHETENIWEMSQKGKFSGRCCLKSDTDVQPDYATEAGSFWALANYDRFKGGRKADVEVHGGATLEEITVPVIEITHNREEIEVYLMPINTTDFHLDTIPEITVSYRKKASVKVFVSTNVQNITIRINRKIYTPISMESNFYYFEMPDIKKAKTYIVDVYTDDNRIAEGLSLIVKKEGASEKNLL